MDECNNAHIRQQSSISSDSIVDETARYEAPSHASDKKICLVGSSLSGNSSINEAALKFGVPVLTSNDGHEHVDKQRNDATVFVVETFDDDSPFVSLYNCRQAILGPTALLQLAQQSRPLPDNTRPLYNLAMSGVVVCFTGFRNKDDLTKLVPLVHHMGASIRKTMSTSVTHLIANVTGGDKYQYAVTFRVPIVNQSWVFSSWEHRNEVDFVAAQDPFIAEHKLKPFYGARVCFLGFPDAELTDMTKALEENGGTTSSLSDSLCTHVVVDEVAENPELFLSKKKAFVVKAEWFWTSVQKATCLAEKDYLFKDCPEQALSPRRESHQATPSSGTRRKRKRLQDTISSLALTPSPVHNKRRSSVSDAGLLSVSGSFLDCTASPDKNLDHLNEDPERETPRKALTARQQVFMELLQTESNYVDILTVIMTMFKRHLELMPEEEALLNNTELKIIFGNLPLIYETHLRMLDELRLTYTNWSEDCSIGNLILKFSTDLLKAYPPFVNFFEEMKEMLIQCDVSKPRFHAFLKTCQLKPECGRQTLQELLIRPVQRLPHISLLLNEILKCTPKNNADHAALEQALAALKEVTTHINEDKRKTEGQRVMFDIFNDIDNCPPDLVSSHRSFISRCEVIQVNSAEGLSAKGDNLVLFLFTDQLEVCKKRHKTFNSAKSPNTFNGFHQKSSKPPYKHVSMLPLKNIKRVINIIETDDCQNVFSLVIRNNDEIKEKLYCFAINEDEIDKTTYLKALCKQMATNACTADSDKFLVSFEADQLDIDTASLGNGTLSKAFKFANRTRLKVGRAFSFSKTPSKLKRAVSSMMSPFGSTTNITPASQLAQMKLASYSNLNELSDPSNSEESSPPIAPMSVQPTRKMKSSSLSSAAFKRL